VANEKTAFFGRDFDVTTLWQYRRRRSAEGNRHKRAAPVVMSVTVPFGDITNPVNGGNPGAVLTVLVS